MKKTIVSIPAILTTKVCIRLFLTDQELSIRHQALVLDDFYTDLPQRGTIVPDHNTVIDKIAKYCKSETFEGVIAYQIVETSTLKQTSAVHGHPIAEVSTVTTAILSKRIFLQGNLIERKEIRELKIWVETEIKKDYTLRDREGFERLGVSVYFADSAKKFLKQSRYPQAIKIGPATLVPFNTKTIQLRVA